MRLVTFLNRNKTIDEEHKSINPKAQLEPQKLLTLMRSSVIESIFPNTAIDLKVILIMLVINCPGK